MTTAAVDVHGLERDRLRKRRNLFTVLAVASLVVSIGISFPRRLTHYREAKRLNEELLRVQAAIVQNQDRTRAVQAEIIKVQQEITELLKPKA